MSNVLRKVQRNGRDAGAIPGRTFERTQGCWNCKNFDNGDKAKAYWRDVCRPRDLRHAQAYEVAGNKKAAQETRDTIKAADEAIKAGVAGLCMIGKAKSDFVVHSFLCDSWSGALGASVAREGGAPDLLPAELKERVDGDE